MNAKTLALLGAAALAHSPKTPVTATGFSSNLPFAKFVEGILLPFTPYKMHISDLGPTEAQRPCLQLLGLLCLLQCLCQAMNASMPELMQLIHVRLLHPHPNLKMAYTKDSEMFQVC